ncbi:MAG: SdpI family protein [Bacillota bacterium]|jgi:uncharacterized membrane protein
MNKKNTLLTVMKKALRTDWPLLLLIIFSLALGFYVYPMLPDQVPSHWNFRGDVDGYSSRTWGAFGIPLMILGFYFLFVVLPLIDPKKENYLKFTRTYAILKYALTVFFFLLYLATIGVSLGYPVNINRLVPMSIAILFVILGNYMSTIRHNYFMGIKTPWTLANEKVWTKTHRLGGKLWVFSGIIGFIAQIISPGVGSILTLVLVIGSAFFAMAYSWWYYQKIVR